MADHDRVAEMLMECTPSVYDSRAERRAAIAEILRREYGRRVPDPAIEKAREALTRYIEANGCGACAMNKTGQHPERCEDCEIKTMEQALALLGEVE